MAEIDYSKEKCWKIKESNPTKVRIEKNRYNEWKVVIEPMTMSYDRFIKITSSISHMESYGESYDYIEGIANMNVTEKGLSQLKEMTDLIVITS